MWTPEQVAMSLLMPLPASGVLREEVMYNPESNKQQATVLPVPSEAVVDNDSLRGPREIM